MKSASERTAGCDAADGGANGIKSKEVDTALFGVVQLKPMKETCVLAGLFGRLPDLGVEGRGHEQDEGKPTEAAHDLTCW
jgi:hypothetical protein